MQEKNSTKLEQSKPGKVLPFAPRARFCSYYVLADDFLWRAGSTLWPNALLEVAWSTFCPGELHAIELLDGRVIFRLVCSTLSTDRGLAFGIHGGDAASRELLPLAFVRRTGRVR